MVQLCFIAEFGNICLYEQSTLVRWLETGVLESYMCDMLVVFDL